MLLNLLLLGGGLLGGIALRYRSLQRNLRLLVMEWEHALLHPDLPQGPAECVIAQQRLYRDKRLENLVRVYERQQRLDGEQRQELVAQQREYVQTAKLAAIGAMAAEIVHELRNPLNALSLNADCLLHDLEKWRTQEPFASSVPASLTQRWEQMVTSIQDQISQLSQITASYLSQARVPAEETRRAPVNQLARDVVGLFEKECVHQGIACDIALYRDEFYAACEPLRLRQALLNVLKNAKYAMPQGGSLRVESFLKGNTFLLAVEDTGSGMNRKVREKIFQPFFTTKSHGTGMGLTVAQSVMEEAFGCLQVDTSLGQGTRVVFQFPA